MNKLLDELIKNNYSIIASNGYFSYGNGIRPVLEPISQEKEFFKGLTVADKVIGKASAMLLIYSGVKRIETLLISKSAIEVLEKYHIDYSYKEVCEYIINRNKDGMCPMEECVKNIDDLQDAYEALRKKLSSIISK